MNALQTRPGPGATFSRREPPGISVVIVSFNDCDNLLRCLASLDHQTHPRSAREIIVIDDGSSDGTADAVRARYPSVTVITKDNEGADVSRNTGIEVSHLELLAFIDADCTADERWLERIVARLDDHPDVMVGGRVSHPGTIWQRLVGIADFGEYLGATPREVATLPTCNMAICRESIADHRFDPRLARAGGDTLFSAALRRRGVRLLYDPAIEVQHHPAVSYADLIARARRYGRSFVTARRIDPSLRYAVLVRAGAPGVIFASLGRVVLDWWRLFRYFRVAGFRPYELPLAVLILLGRRVLAIPAALEALRFCRPAAGT